MEISKYKQLKKVIIKANPEKEWEWDCKSCRFTFDEPIRLADVLLAINKNKIEILCSPYGDGMACISEEIDANIPFCNWNLKKDSLDKQSNECKQFLINLLVE